ncbi:U3 small nucleolar ribonucleoprotein complex, subunit Mpp10 [Schizothecium vesticola]|uniref:U3 small nucleolar ribonucleoprotein protein MPP10 n=1 Tax=Schizothecium vesticola TaxID=314040 RepID=A0AA40EP07_9PEZI|nr:U3 small nucleolar ribonucleoprotein complex, subunit Mpp10 [Schizothecium vesticola]
MEGGGSTTSSLTSTSHTLTHMPSMANATATTGAPDGSPISVFLDSTAPPNRHLFLQPPLLLNAGSLQVAKELLDGLAGQVADHQQVRLQEAGKKRKRELIQDKDAILKLRKLHIDGFETGQVWQQAKKIITSALHESSELLRELEEDDVVVEGSEDDEETTKPAKFSENDIKSGSDDYDSASASSESGSGSDADSEELEVDDSDASDDEDGESVDEDELDVEGEDDEEEDEGESDVADADVEEEGSEDVDVEEKGSKDEGGSEEEEAAVELETDATGLNDGFFSLKEFNKQTQWFENQDARADPNTDAHSDDEEIDWHGDPFKAKPKRTVGADEDEDDSDIDMDDADLKAAQKLLDEDALDSDGEGEDTQANDLGDVEAFGMDLTANDVYYKDFFAPPAKKKKPGSFKKRPAMERPPQPDEAEIERAENDVRRDLFEDMSDHSGSEDALSDVSAGNPKSRRSAHERRQAKLAEEIRKLESELVAKRAWTLSGEASAVDRPVNSLLEEDLDFEHVGKPVPLITEEVSETIEALIKRRILAQEFDELIRRRPDTLNNPKHARRGLVEVEDKKGDKSLAELYEEEHTKNADPDAYVSQSDDKLERDEEEIKRMWQDVCGRLDALSSWHYKPKPAAPTLTVVADVATIAMEDAQPATAQGVAGGESMIAPQEVYAPSKRTAEDGEVVAKDGLPVARQEMSRDDKLRKRRREKERIRKAGGLDATKHVSGKAKAQQETMNDLKKGGVRVINRKGEVMGLDGKKAKDAQPAQTSGSYKL